MKTAGRVHVGCSGWQYTHWRGDFYPADLPPSCWFAHYALTFDTVELNNSFYRLPPPERFAKWRDHPLGPILNQLPPRWPVDLHRFEISCGRFREPSGYDDRVFAQLEHHKVALCLHDMHVRYRQGRSRPMHPRPLARRHAESRRPLRRSTARRVGGVTRSG